MNSRRLKLLIPLLALASACQAQNAVPPDKADKLVNQDTAFVSAKGTVNGRFNVRVFGGDEKQAYGTLELNAGLGHGLAVILRGTFSGTRTFNGSGFDIRHGGTDFEAALKYAVPELPNVAVEAGVSLPNTPAQKKVFGTGQVVYEYWASPVRLYAGARGVTGSNSNLAGICGGLSVELAKGFDLFGDVTWVLSGQNTYSTTTGRLEQISIYGVGLRYSPPNPGATNLSLEAGATNALGGSTGMSLSPALNTHVGLFAALQVRF